MAYRKSGGRSRSRSGRVYGKTYSKRAGVRGGGNTTKLVIQHVFQQPNSVGVDALGTKAAAAPKKAQF